MQSVSRATGCRDGPSSLLAGVAIERKLQGSRLAGYHLICSLDGSNGLMAGNWRKFQVRTVATSISDRTSQSTKLVFLIMSDSVQTRAHKLRHVFKRILVRYCASHSAGNAITQP